jgi:signal transduction histidine kinase/phage shock protein PspC (stress-responsive transcriptional regulator)
MRPSGEMRAGLSNQQQPDGLGARPGQGVSRSRSDRVIAGVAAGIGDWLRVDPVVVRLAFVALAAAGGFGIGLYVVAWTLLPEQDPESVTPTRVAPDLRRTSGFGLMVLGALVFLREVELWFGDSLTWPVALAAFGSAIIWTRGDGYRAPGTLLEGWSAKVRVVVGTLVVIGATGLFLSQVGALTEVPSSITVTAVVVGGFGLVLTPSIWRLTRQASDERRERIRFEERAEVAAHLHDSVLQTLALIQRTQNAAEMVTLARAQERELRAWLYGRASKGGAGNLSIALNEMAGRLERLYSIAVDVVLVGDVPLDDRTRAVLDACGEAVHNAARHSGADSVSVYVEVEPHALTAYVRDEGKGFALAEVPGDRHGIAESIVGRMQRHGGRARVMSEPGEGTEVELWLPLQ